MDQRTVSIIGVTLLVLFLALAIPTMMDKTTYPNEADLELSEGDTREVTNGLEITLTDTSNTDATVDLTDLETGVTANYTIATGDTVSYSLPGGDGNITADTTTNQDATFTVDYSPTYGYSPAGEAIIDNIGLLLILIVFTIVVGGMVVVIQ